MKKFKFILLVLTLTLLSICVLGLDVKAETIDEVISSKILDVKSVPFTREDDMYIYGDSILSQEYPGYYFGGCNDDYTKCDLINGPENTTISDIAMNYVYDNAVKTVVDNLVKNIPDGGKMFKLTDIEYINYRLFMASQEEYIGINLATYSSEIRKFIGYKNFEVEPRMGDGGSSFDVQIGTATFTYDGTIYAYADGIGAYGNSIIYIDSNATDIEAAIKDRLSQYFDIEEVVKYDGFTVNEYLEDEIQEWKDEYASNIWLKEMYSTEEDYINYMQDEYYNNEDSYLYDIKDALPDFYVIVFNDEIQMTVAVVKDSSKVNDDVTIITNDVETNVTISTDSKLIPLDTLIKVARLTGGEDYEKIVKLLNNDNIEMFDLRLFSKSANSYVTKLEDGSFEVRLPISDKLKGKDLIVYYVDENDKIVEHSVKIEDGYAIFTTNHFSIYTLAETTKTPATGDNILVYVTLLGLSVVGIADVIYVKKKINI